MQSSSMKTMCYYSFWFNIAMAICWNKSKVKCHPCFYNRLCGNQPRRAQFAVGSAFWWRRGKNALCPLWECPVSAVYLPGGPYWKWTKQPPQKQPNNSSPPYLTEPVSEWFSQLGSHLPISLSPPLCSGLRVNSAICWWTAVVALEQCDLD